MQQSSTMEIVAKERREVAIEAVDGLQMIERSRRLNPVERAALEALEKVLVRAARCRYAVITAESIKRPVAVAQKALEAFLCAR